MRSLRTYLFTLAIIFPPLVSCSGIDIGDMKDDYVTLCLNTPRIAADTDTKSMPVDGEFFPWQSRIHAAQTADTRFYEYSIALWICDKGTLTPHMDEHKNNNLSLRAECYIPSGTRYYYWRKNGKSYSPSVRLRKDIDIYAYYPTVTTRDFTPDKVPFTTNEQKDWMWAETAIDGNHNVSFLFHHAMTCIEIRLSTTYANSINLRNIVLKDRENSLVSSGTMDIRNGELVFTADKSSITISGNNANSNLIPVHKEDNTSYQSFCFLMPEKAFEPGSLTLTFYYDGGTVSRTEPYVIPSSFKDKDGVPQTITALEKGKRYVLNLMIDNSVYIKPLSFVTEDWTVEEIDLNL